MDRRLLLDLLHLTAWGQLGVLIRYYVGRVFGAACKPGSWVPCVTSPGLSRPGGALFTDLPANVLGCAIMGLLSPADLLLLGRTPPPPPSPAAAAAAAGQQPSKGSAAVAVAAAGSVQPGVPCAALPQDSPLQRHASLLLGLRTGLCGCLTTFASWLLQMVEMMVGTSPSTHKAGTEWFEAVCGLALGCLVAQAGLGAGQQLARMAARHWHNRAVRAARQQNSTANHAAVLADGTKAMPASGLQQPATPVRPAQPVAGQGAQPGQVVMEMAGISKDTPPDWAATPDASAKSTAAMSDAAAPELPFTLDGPTATPAHPPVPQPASASSQAANAVPNGPAGSARHAGWTAHTWCDLAAALVLVVLSGVSVALIVVVATGYDGDAEVTGQEDFILWVSILVSPLGCLTRWRLSVLNQRPAASPLAWFPLGTWLANMGGCLLDFIMSVILLRSHGLSPLSSDVVSAVMTGVGGSLSTVSTWVVELQKFGEQVHDNHRALLYSVGSLVPAVAMGLLVYGTAAWTLP